MLQTLPPLTYPREGDAAFQRATAYLAAQAHGVGWPVVVLTYIVAQTAEAAC